VAELELEDDEGLDCFSTAGEVLNNEYIKSELKLLKLGLTEKYLLLKQNSHSSC
jgi:hypothetical protein